jgi:hypothetical protein
VQLLASLLIAAVSFIWAISTSDNAQAASAGQAVSYNKFSDVSLKKCWSKKFFGQKVEKCINPGSVGGGVNGTASVLTFANADTGEVGAVLVLEQNFVVKIFGQSVAIGATCTYNNSKSSSAGFFVGYSLSTPPIPSVSVVDILTAAVSARLKAVKGPMAGASTTAAKSGGRFNSGYTGAVDNSKFKSLLSNAAAGCTLRYPDAKLFSGIPSIDLYKVGINFAVGAVNWSISSNGGASVTLQMSMEPIAQVGGEKVSFKVLGNKVSWNLPGYAFKKQVSLMNQRVGF